MKCYTLLRDNTESGPYTLDEIIAKDLKTADLVWIEGKSRSWQYPNEVDELKNFVKEPQSRVQTSSKPFCDEQRPRISIILPPQYKRQEPQDFQAETIANSSLDSEPELETKYTQSLDEIKEMYVHHLKSKPTFKRKDFKNLFNMAALFAGLILGAVVIKNIVESFEQNLAENDIKAAAATPVNDLAKKNNEPAADPSYRNALTTETVVLDTTVSKSVKKMVAAKKENIKKLVSISANKYKVGVFGGINNLNLTVNNRSSQVLDKVNVEVSYLKQNGDVVKTENYYLRSVSPKSVKILNVPASNRGVKIKYRITEIKSHPYKVEMLNT